MAPKKPPAKRAAKVAPEGLPFNPFIGYARNPIEWLREVPRNMDLFQAMRPELPAGQRDLARSAKRDAQFAVEIIDGRIVDTAETASLCAMETVAAVWTLAVSVGAMPRLERDQRRQLGTRKPRRPKVDEWIDRQLQADRNAKSPDLWRRAPGWITDDIAERSFSARVTRARKRRASK